LGNRAVLTSVGPGDAVDGLPGDAHEDDLLRLAGAGAGLVVTEMTAVSPEGRVTPGDAGLWSEAQRDRWAAAIERVHSASATKVACLLRHAGRRGATRPRPQGVDRPL